eukprot:SAG31_NODE_11133_length_1062_cov_1.519211_2_plen_87_part_00
MIGDDERSTIGGRTLEYARFAAVRFAALRRMLASIRATVACAWQTFSGAFAVEVWNIPESHQRRRDFLAAWLFLDVVVEAVHPVIL